MSETIGLTVRRFIDAEEMHGKSVHRLDTALEMLKHLKCTRGNYHAQLLSQYMGQKLGEHSYTYGELEKLIPFISESAEVEMFEAYFNMGQKKEGAELWIGYQINRPGQELEFQF